MTPTLPDKIKEFPENGQIPIKLQELKHAPKKNPNNSSQEHSLEDFPDPDEYLDVSSESKVPEFKGPLRLRMSEFMNYVGPGFLITIACLDPGNLSGDMAVGQLTRYRLTWILILSHILCYIYQSISLTIGCVSKRDISTLCRYSFSKRVHVTLWMMAELALIASDTQEVLGTAIALKILFGVPLIMGVMISIVLAFAILHLQKYGQRILEGVFAFFVFLMAFSFWINYLKLGFDFRENIEGIIPRLRVSDLPVAVSLIGAIIMPQNLYLHSSLVLTRKIKPEEIKKAIRFFRLETKIVILFSLFINIAIVGTFAHFSNEGLIELQEAHKVLEHSLGFMGAFVWAIGLFSSGQSATVAGALTGQYIMEGFLQIRISRHKRMLLTRMLSLLPCILVIQLANIERANIVLNIVQFIQLPFVLIPTLKFSTSEDIVGTHKLRGKKLILTYVLTAFLILLNAFQLANQFPQTPTGVFLGFFFLSFYFGFLIYVARLKMKKIQVKRDQLDIELLSFGC